MGKDAPKEIEITFMAKEKSFLERQNLLFDNFNHEF